MTSAGEHEFWICKVSGLSADQFVIAEAKHNWVCIVQTFLWKGSMEEDENLMCQHIDGANTVLEPVGLADGADCESQFVTQPQEAWP